MKKKAMRLLLVFLVLFPMVLTTHAAEQDDIDVQLTVLKIEVVSGEEIFAPVAVIRPGDVLQYTLVYKIIGKDEILELLTQLPIPEGMEYVPDSARPSNVHASLDNNDFSPVPLQRTVKKINGQESREEIPAWAYRTLGWPMRGLAPGDEITVSARLRVNFIPEPSGAK